MKSAGQSGLQILEGIQALNSTVPAIDELPERFLLHQGVHMLEKKAFAKRGQLWGIMDL